MATLAELQTPEGMRAATDKVLKYFRAQQTFESSGQIEPMPANETTAERLARIQDTGVLLSSEDIHAVIKASPRLSSEDVQALLAAFTAE